MFSTLYFSFLKHPCTILIKKFSIPYFSPLKKYPVKIHPPQTSKLKEKFRSHFPFPQKIHSFFSTRIFKKKKNERNDAKITDGYIRSKWRRIKGRRDIEGVKHRGRGFSHPRVVVRVINGGEKKGYETIAIPLPSPFLSRPFSLPSTFLRHRIIFRVTRK